MPRRFPSKAADRRALERPLAEFLARGGTITYCPPCRGGLGSLPMYEAERPTELVRLRRLAESFARRGYFYSWMTGAGPRAAPAPDRPAGGTDPDPAERATSCATGTESQGESS